MNGTGNTVVAQYEYAAINYWCDNKITKTTITKKRTGKPEYKRISEFEYYPNGILHKSIADSDIPDKAITTEYYDINNLGLPKSVKITTAAEPELITTNKYDNEGRFVIQTTNPKGFITKQTYDTEFGNVTSSTDINGHKIRYYYDKFGKPVKGQEYFSPIHQ